VQRPYGWLFGSDGKLRADPEEIHIVRQAQQLRNEGDTLHQIANDLTFWGHRNRAGHPFNTTQVWRMLQRHARATLF
jgi:hypothetical protein